MPGYDLGIRETFKTCVAGLSPATSFLGPRILSPVRGVTRTSCVTISIAEGAVAMADEVVTLDFLAKQQRQIIDDLAAMRAQFGVMQDDIRVLTAMALRQDNSTKSMLDLIHRHDQRIRDLEKTP
jgi:hypothetical protein